MGLGVQNCKSDICIDMTGMNRLFGARFNRLRSILTIVIDVAVKGEDLARWKEKTDQVAVAIREFRLQIMESRVKVRNPIWIASINSRN
jgi:hypothetical protein